MKGEIFQEYLESSSSFTDPVQGNSNEIVRNSEGQNAGWCHIQSAENKHQKSQLGFISSKIVFQNLIWNKDVLRSKNEVSYLAKHTYKKY